MPPAVAASANEVFARLGEAWLAETLRLNPVGATQAGEHRYDHLLPDIGLAGREAQLALSRRTLAALAAIDRAQLSRPAQVDAALLENQLRYDIFQLEQLQEYAWNPLGYTGTAGSALYGLMAREFAPLPERLRSATRRMELLSEWLAEARRQLVPARVPKIFAETAVRQNAGLDSIIDDMILVQARQLPAAEQARLQQAAAALKVSAKTHGEWLKTELVPAARGDWRLGQRLYDQKLALALNSPIERGELRRRAETVIARTRAEMYGLARQVLAGRAGAPPLPAEPTDAQQQAAIAAALDLAAAERPPRDKLVAFARQTLAEATAFVKAKGLVTVPAGADWEIIDLPEFQQGVAVAYADTPGPLDKNLRAFYAVSPIPRDWTDEQTTSFLREYNTRAIHELTIHEAMPGHLLQGAFSNRYPSTLRAYLWSGSMVEGWGMYAEDIMREAGYLGGDPLYQLVHLKWRLRATMNAIIDQMAHVDGAERAQVMDLLTRVAFQEEREAAGKWTRLQLSSAQLPTYFVGYSEWRDLRAAAEARGNFDQRAFHDQALSFGSPPVRFIRQLMFGEPIR
ncbi:MAG TPA: DUF885 domain-containing protein [Sphingomicrobium sp.]|nr:DUF885 domain-containing protein [Sphingomicrobium sp.]